MKKLNRNLLRVVFSLVLVISIFGIYNVFAGTDIFNITKAEVVDKTNKTIVNKANLTSGIIDNDVIFTDLNDYVKYAITIKNITDDNYKILSISDDNNSPYLEYTYDDLSNVTINSGEEKVINLQIKYVQLTSNLIISNTPFNIEITYEKEDGSQGSTVVDPTNDEKNEESSTPKTYDGITIYVIFGTVSLIGLIITIANKKDLSKTLAITGIFGLITLPFVAKAEIENSTLISFNPNLIRNSYTELIPGIHFNYAINKLSTNNPNLGIEYYYERYNIVDNSYNVNEDGYLFKNTVVTSIERASYDQYAAVKDSLNDDNLVSTDTSNVPTYIWFDNGKIYYYSVANTIYMNQDASSMFLNMPALTNIDFATIDTSKTVSMGNMFRGDRGLGTLDLSTFNTSNVIDFRDFINDSNIYSINVSSFDTSKVIYFQGMFNSYKGETINLDNFVTTSARYLNHMFAYNTYLKTVDLTRFDTSNVQSMAAMFMYADNLESIDLTRFNTSNVTDMSNMFRGCQKLTTLDLSSFNTRNVTTMGDMLSVTYSLNSVDLSSFDTSNVTDIHGMFAGSGLPSVDVTNFNTAKVEDFSYMFSLMPNIVEIDLSYFNTKKATDMRNMFENNDNLEAIYASEDFVTTNVTSSMNMFFNSTKIDGGNGTLYDLNHIEKEYAHLDGGPSNPGYFRDKGTYRVLFDSRGGSSIDQKIINRGETVGTLETPVKQGFTFVGWYLDDTKIESSYVPTKNIVLVAKYQTDDGYDANVYSTWIWTGTLNNDILDSEIHMDESILIMKDLGIQEVYLALEPENLQSNHLYFEKLYQNNIKAYVLYGDPVFVEERVYPNVIDYDMQMVHDYNEANAGTSHIEGIHYDVEYHGYKYDGVNTCPDGNSEEALTCPARQYFVNFVKRGYAKAQELGLKTQYDVTVYGTNYSFYYNENHEVVNLLDEIIDYCDDLIIMAYGNSPKNTLPSFIYKGDYTYQGVTMYMDKTYYEKMHERNKNIYVGQEIEVFRNTAQELVDYPELGPIYLPEYEGENGTTYVYTYDFVMNLFNDLEDKFKDNGIDDIRIVVHDYSQLVDLYKNR